jgi:ABC-type antimicrobial peptide transport system permease subunit
VWCALALTSTTSTRNNGTESDRPESRPRRHQAVAHSVFAVQCHACVCRRQRQVSGGANGIVVVDYDTLMPYVAHHMSPNTPVALRDAIRKFDLAHFATNIIANLPPDERVATYLDTNADRLTKTVTTFGSVIVFESGYSRVQTSMPCVDAMSLRWALSLLLSLLLDVIAAVLLFLSGVLVYALLGVDVERRSNELGVLRLLGARRRRLIGLLLAHAAAYALPATIVGLIVAQCTMPFVSMALSLLSGAPASYWLAFDGVWRAVVIGIGMPALAGIVPISNALARSVASAFEARGAPAPTTQVTIERSESAAVSAPLLVAGSLTAVFGFGIYYLLPLSLLSLDIELLVDLFVALLCGMMLGMVLLSLNIATALQRALAWLTVSWWEADIVGVLLGKNLVAHRGRHRKTVVVFAVSVAFIIFLSVSYSIQVDEVSYQSLQQNGADLLVSPAAAHHPVPPAGRELLLNTTAGLPDVTAFTWATPPLADAAFVVQATRGSGEPSPTVIKTMGSLKSSNVALYGVPYNFFTVGDPRFLQPSDGTSASVAAEQLANELYGHDRTLLLGAADAKKLNVAVGDRLLVQPGGGFAVQFRVAGILDTSPYFSFSRFTLGRGLQTVIVSLPEFIALRDQVLQANAAQPASATSFFGNGESAPERRAGAVLSGLQTVPLGALLVQLKRSNGDSTPSVGAVDRVRRALRGAAYDLGDALPTLNFVDAQQRVGQLSSTTKVIFGFFGFATVMSMTISFFALVSSTYVTVLEQLREIGVLRSVGISRWRMLRCYVYEALIIVLSSVILGLLIGVAMGWTMSAQRILFSQLPIPFSVPWSLFLIMCALSVIFGFVAAVLPLRSVLWKRTPVEIMRGRS